MTSLRHKALTVLSICVLTGAWRTLPAQDLPGNPSGEEATVTFDEEVVVRGRSRAFLRDQFEIAEDAVYARFNDINSSEEFDIHCQREAPTGSRVLRRVCQANFLRDLLAQSGTETARSMQGGFSIPAAQFQGEAIYKQSLLADEMRRLARQDSELMRALVRLARIDEALNGNVNLRGIEQGPPVVRIRTPGAEPLPYGSSRIAEVLIRTESWRHDLTERIFAVANVYGEIRGIRLECTGGLRELVVEEAIEWSIPDALGDCAVNVDAPQGTTFVLYEFGSPIP